MSELKDALAVLELPSKTTRSEVQRAYYTLLRVWHPDRFAGDPELQAEADEKTKRITLAYGTVMNHLKARQAALERRQREEALEKERKKTRAREREREEAEKGNAYAQFNVGVRYAEGRGVAQDDVEAARWYRLAAEQGDADAQFNLGVMYNNGHGVAQDYMLAYAWVNLAAANAEPSSRNDAVALRDELAQSLSPAKLLEAQALSRQLVGGGVRDQPKPSERPARKTIPQAVKTAVWRRDEGRCVECGSKENLEYDHIIPVVKGGSNTERNIQLLCESCNRSKGTSI